MITIGSSLFQPAVGGQQIAAAEDRRTTSPGTIAPTSRIGEGTIEGPRTGQPDPRVLQPVPTGGLSLAERVHSEPERPVADLGERKAAPQGNAAPTPPDPLREPVPPLRQFVDIPTRTTAQIQRVREESRAAEAKAAETDAAMAEEDADRATTTGPMPGTMPAGTARDAASRIDSSLNTLRQIQAAEAPKIDIHS